MNHLKSRTMLKKLKTNRWNLEVEVHEMKVTITILIVSFFFLSGVPGYAVPRKLLEAYKKEYSFLEETKRQLRGRLAQVEKLTKSKVEQGEEEIERLQRGLVGLKAQNDDLEEKLQVSNRNDDTENDEERLLDLLERADHRMKEAGLKFENGKELSLQVMGENLKKMFIAGGRLITRGGQVRRVKGKYFLADGKLVSGDLIQVGRIATFGLAADGVGALAPAGEGRLKLWPTSSQKTALALSRGERIPSLEILVYETLEKPLTPKKTMSLLETIRAGGIIAWVIVGIGVLAFLLILVRMAILFFYGRGAKKLARKVEPLVAEKNYDAAKIYLKSKRGASSHVIRAAIEGMGFGRERINDKVSEALLGEVPKIERFGAAITVFAAVAPLLGLLGTVTGMISTFDVITEHGTGDPKLLSGGISEALITTQLGLCVAIPTLLVGTLLRGWAMGIQSGIEQAAMKIINIDQYNISGSLEELEGGEKKGTFTEKSSQKAAAQEETTKKEAGKEKTSDGLIIEDRTGAPQETGEKVEPGLCNHFVLTQQNSAKGEGETHYSGR